MAMIHQMNVSRHENLTHFIWHRVHRRNPELCLSFFSYSLYIYESAFLCEYLSSNVNISCSPTTKLKALQTSWNIWSPSAQLLLYNQGSQGEGFQPRLQFPPLFCIVLSANQVLTSFV